MATTDRRLPIAVRAVLLAGLLATGLPAVAGADEITIPTPVTATSAGPAEDGAIIVQRSAGPVAGEPDGWRLNMDVFLRNDGLADVTLEEVRVSYAGGSAPAGLVVPTDPDAAAPWVIDRVPTDVNEPVEVAAETIPAGDDDNPRRARVPEDRILPFPLPEQVSVEFHFAGFSTPVTVTRGLVEYVPPGGDNLLPFARLDLPDGQFVSSGQNHRFGSAHRGSASQRLAEDFSVVRWTGSGWTTLVEGGASDVNEDRLIWDVPVYAMADGVVDTCFSSVPDNLAPGEDNKHPDLFLDADDPDKLPGGGNSFWIEHAPGEFTLYAHLQAGTVNLDLCPDAADDGGLKYPPGVPGTQVKAGQLLGWVGNSGSSSGPHLHLHTQRGRTSGNARPMAYHNLRIVDAGSFDPDEDEPAWRTVDGAAVTISGASVNGTQIGGFVGYGTVDRVLYDPLPAVNLEVTKVGGTNPAVAGTELTYTMTVTNHGPDVATDVLLADQLPPEVEFVSDDGECAWTVGETRLCVLGDLAAGEQAAPITMTVAIPHDLVHDHGGPVQITNTATVTSFGGPFEATPDDNVAEEHTTVIAVADLELVTYEVLAAPPGQLLIGEDATLTLRAVVTNHGPSWPMDARLDTTVVGGGVMVAPNPAGTIVPAVELDELRVVDEDFTITCQQPGPKQLTFTTEVSPAKAADIDPDPSNNGAQLVVGVECVVPIAVNIRPGNRHNLVQPASNGVVSVAALTTDAGEYGLPVPFDATLIDPATVRFGHPDLVWFDTGGAEPHGDAHVKDAHELDDQTKDGDLDLVLRFVSSDTGLVPGDATACVKGHYTIGAQTFTFFGCDDVATIP